MTEYSSAARPRWLTITLLALSAGLIFVFVLLGNWQIRRLAWKVDLIEAVETRAYGVPMELPNQFDPDLHTYQRATVEGVLDITKAALVKAITDIGPGYWVMVPMHTTNDETFWINTGFVPPSQRDPENWVMPSSPVVGLLRDTEPDGTLIESNQPEIDRWVSRDAFALSEARGLEKPLPYFMDAEFQTAPQDWPRGGLTIVKFRNTHLSYALTWYAMALLFAATLIWLVWTERRHRS